MSYEDRSLRQSYSFPAQTIAGSATTMSIKGPAGRRGRVVAIHASVTTTVVGAAAAVKVGVAADDDKFMALLVGAQTAPEALSTETAARNAAGVPDLIEANEEVIVTVGTGTSGAVVPTVTVDWF
jgi:hypothetical protein